MVKKIISGEKTFKKEVLESEIPVLVDFYADWCAPCRAMSPIIDELSNQFHGKCKVLKINVEDDIEIVIQYNITSIPAFIIFNKGRKIEQFVGMIKKQELEIKLFSSVSS